MIIVDISVQIGQYQGHGFCFLTNLTLFYPFNKILEVQVYNGNHLIQSYTILKIKYFHIGTSFIRIYLKPTSKCCITFP